MAEEEWLMMMMMMMNRACTSLSTVFQSYRDNGRVNMKGSVKLSAVKVRKQYRIQRYSIPIPRDPKSGALTARQRGRFDEECNITMYSFTLY